MIANFLRPFLLAACVLLAGCYPESTNPLSAPEASLFDDRLPGVYEQRESGDDRAFWHFRYRQTPVKGREGETIPLLEVVGISHEKDNGGLDTVRFEAFAVRLGKSHYLSFLELEKDGRKKQPAHYGLARYDVNWLGDLRVWMPSATVLAEAVRSGQLRGKVTRGSAGETVLLTDSTERLAAFVAAADQKKLFNATPMVFGRMPW